MNFPDFHDGYFDGFRIHERKGVVDFFLRTVEQKAFTLTLYGVKRMNVSEVWESNIIFDLLFRESNGITVADIEELFHGPCADNEAAAHLSSVRDQGLKVMEMGSSYGATALVLLERYEIAESSN